MLEAIAGAVESLLQNPISRAEVNLFIAEQFNLSNQSDRALEFIEQAIQEIARISGEEEYLINQLKCKVARQLCKAGEQKRSLNTLAEALQQSDRLEDPESRDYQLMNVSEAYAEIELYDRAIKIGLTIEDSYKQVWHLFRSIAYTAIHNHHHEQIQNILSAIGDYGEQQNFLFDAANAYSANQQMEQAIALVAQITSLGTKAEVLATAVESSDQIALAQALDLLNQAEVYAQAEQDTVRKAQALTMVAERYIDWQQFTHARTLLVQAQQLAMSLSADDLIQQIPRHDILSGIAIAFGQLDKHEGTIETTDVISVSNFKGLALHYAGINQKESQRDRLMRLNRVFESVSRMSDFTQGKEILTQIIEQISSFDQDYRRSLLISMVNAYFNLRKNVG